MLLGPASGQLEPEMILAMDVQYDDATATVAAVGFTAWSAAAPSFEWVSTVTGVAPYEAGSFYRRELPCLLQCLGELPDEVRDGLACIVVDGYVWLDADARPGLGAHLYEALDGALSVVGVAKNEFANNDAAVGVTRGESARPLYVTAVGVDVAATAQRVRSMHGEFRIPTLLRYVDQLCRNATA